MALRAADPRADCIISPAFEIKDIVAPKETRAFDALLLTSRHAVDAARHYPHVRAICVGDATAHYAKQAGLNALSASGDVRDLVNLVLELNISSCLHLHGSHTRPDLKSNLETAGVQLYSQAVYEQVACTISQSAKAKIAQCTQMLVPVYSPRSAQIASQHLRSFTGGIILVAISENAAFSWCAPQPVQIIVAKHPNATTMLNLILTQMHKTP
jgi:uroporphyrinogen-III synthase